MIFLNIYMYKKYTVANILFPAATMWLLLLIFL